MEEKGKKISIYQEASYAISIDEQFDDENADDDEENTYQMCVFKDSLVQYNHSFIHSINLPTNLPIISHS